MPPSTRSPRSSWDNAERLPVFLVAIRLGRRDRLQPEARTAAAVRHENIVGIFAVEEEPLPYLVMEYIPGITLQQRLDQDRRQRKLFPWLTGDHWVCLDPTGHYRSNSGG